MIKSIGELARGSLFYWVRGRPDESRKLLARLLELYEAQRYQGNTWNFMTFNAQEYIYFLRFILIF